MKIIRLRLCLCSPFAFVRGEMTSSIKLWRMLERGYNFTLYTHKTLCGYFCCVTIFYFYKHDCRAGKKKSLQSWNQTLLPKAFFIFTISLPPRKKMKKDVLEYVDDFSSSLPSQSCEKSAELSVASFINFLMEHFFASNRFCYFSKRTVAKTFFSMSCFNSWMWFIWNARRKMKKKKKIGNNLHQRLISLISSASFFHYYSDSSNKGSVRVWYPRV